MAAPAHSLTTGFSSDLDQPADDVNYRPVCGAAIVAMLLGAASFAAFFGPILWAAGFFAMVVSCYAFYRIYTTNPTPMGKTPALIGLSLSLFFTMGAVAKHYFSQWLVREESREVARLWMDAMADKNFELVHQLTKEPLTRDPRLDSLDEVYSANVALQEELQAFTRGDRLKVLIQAAARGDVWLEDAKEVVIDDGFDQVTWRLIASHDGQEEPYLLGTRRSVKFRGDPGGWRVVSIDPEMVAPPTGPPGPPTAGPQSSR